MSSALFTRVRAYLRQEVDPGDRSELEALLEEAEGGSEDALHELDARFSEPLRFGTAGIRGILGAGKSRMNRALVIRVTYGVGSYLLENVPDAKRRGVVIARDARRHSEVFQEEAASVCSALGLRVHWLSGPQPTPLLAFAVKHLKAAAGIAVTASHNPPEYNGYKVYAENGAQIIPPVDEAISKKIDAAPGAAEVKRDRDDELVGELEGLEATYLEAIRELAPRTRHGEAADLRIAYSPLHGVAQALFFEALREGGFRQLFSVAEQAEPDGAFPTLPFPNPEEPGVLDRVLALAREQDCDLVVVHDPDGDRLGAAVRRGPADYVVLNGNQLGVLLAHHVLEHSREPSPLVVSTVVSSRMLSKMASELGVRYQDTLTGFKWIANEAMRIEREEQRRFVFGYEEALGYTVGDVVRDKDGIGSGLVLAEMAALSKARGETLLDALEQLFRRFGLFVNRQRSVALRGPDAPSLIRATMDRLRSHPSFELGSERVEGIWDLSEGSYRYPDGKEEERGGLRGDVLLYDLANGGRVAVRPSGTEPKLKLYLEVVESEVSDEARSRAEGRLRALEQAMLARAELPRE